MNRENSPYEKHEMLFSDNAPLTSDVEKCANKGCGFNADGKCTAHGTECFGYIETKD